ncbi:MAG: YgiT-type zinc finger protein [Blastocatellia bacterium]
MIKCEICGSELTIKTGQTYHFTESGVDNVYLENLKVEVCKKCKTTAPYLPRPRQLMETIGRAIALQPAPLTGDEVRFLRKQAGYKAREWAALVRVDAATQSRWESGEQTIGPQSDLLHRLVYFCQLAEREGSKLPDRMVEQLAASKDERGQAPAIIINVDNLGGYVYRSQTATERRSRRAA